MGLWKCFAVENDVQSSALRGFLRWLVLWSLEFGVQVFRDFLLSILAEKS